MQRVPDKEVIGLVEKVLEELVGVLVLESPELFIAPPQLPNEPFRMNDLSRVLVNCLTGRHLAEKGGEGHQKGVSVPDTLAAAAAAVF